MKNTLLLLLLLRCSIVIAQQTSTDTIHWKPGDKLTWGDFRGMPDINSNGMAGTSSGFIYHSYYTSDTTLVFVVATIFFKKYSWVKNDYKDSATLNHEQGHFDITEVYARKLRATFKNYQLNKTTMIEDCKRIYDSLRGERDKDRKSVV